MNNVNPMWTNLLSLDAANDNDPMWNEYDPADYENFDPALMPDDFFYDDDTTLDVVAFMSRFA